MRQDQTTLRINRESDRWMVGSHELHAGDYFELKLAGGSWLTVRFEWKHHSDQPPSGYCVLPLATGSASFVLPLGAVVRMPEAP